MTPRPLAAAIIVHFQLAGAVLDPCRGEGAFYDQFPSTCVRDWCEVTDGRDFLARDFGGERYSWVVSNPPYSLWRAFNRRAMEVADNVVWLTPINHLWLKARLRDIDEAGFGVREILRVPTPAKPWPQSGFAIGAIHLQRGYAGPITHSHL